MTWATERRLDFIDFLLATRGEVQRADIMEIFGVSEGQASADINEFVALEPGAMRYDKTRKRYVPARRPYRRRRKGVWVEAIDWGAAIAPAVSAPARARCG